jgi:hypothetical protein
MYPLPFHAAAEEVADQGGDLLAMCLQGEMPGVEQMEFRIGQIAFEGFRSGRPEDLVVATPGQQGGRLMGTEVLLERRIAVEVELIVPEQLQLDRIALRAVQAGRPARR